MRQALAEERRAVARDVIAVAQRRVRAAAPSSVAQRLLALLERRAGEIAPVEVEEIEDEVDELVGAARRRARSGAR